MAILLDKIRIWLCNPLLNLTDKIIMKGDLRCNH